MIDWMENIWMTDEELRSQMDETEWEQFIDSLKIELLILMVPDPAEEP